LVDAGAAGVIGRDAAIAVAHHSGVALFADDDLAGSETFFEREEMTGVCGGTGDDREDADVFVSDGVEQAPIAVGFGRFGWRRVWGSCAHAEGGNAKKTAEESGKKGTIHEKPPEARLCGQIASATWG